MPAGRALEPAGRVSGPAGMVSEPAGRALKPGQRALDSALRDVKPAWRPGASWEGQLRDQGMDKTKENGAYVVLL